MENGRKLRPSQMIMKLVIKETLITRLPNDGSKPNSSAYGPTKPGTGIKNPMVRSNLAGSLTIRPGQKYITTPRATPRAYQKANKIIVGSANLLSDLGSKSSIMPNNNPDKKVFPVAARDNNSSKRKGRVTPQAKSGANDESIERYGCEDCERSSDPIRDLVPHQSHFLLQ